MTSFLCTFYDCGKYGSKGKGKGTPDILPLLLTPPQKHSGIARVLKGSHSLPAQPHVQLQSE